MSTPPKLQVGHWGQAYALYFSWFRVWDREVRDTHRLAPASLFYADLGVGLAQAGDAYSVGGFEYLLPNLLGFLGGKTSSCAAKEAGFHSVLSPLLDFYVPRSVDRAFEIIEERNDN